MAVQIQSIINAVPLNTSRDDGRPGDLVTLNAIGAASTWAWALVYKPQDKNRVDSTATLAGAVNGPGPLTFTIDNDGAYLIRLVVDLGLPSEAIIFVRLRSLTKFADLSLVAAGERKDDTKNPPNIPFDADVVGWADDQNFNVSNLLCLIQHSASSGRIIYVDANRGKLNSNTPDDPTIAEGWADFSTVTAAITAALTDNDFNGGVPPTIDSPIIIAVRPGLYEEDITFVPYVHVIAWPSTGSVIDNLTDGDRSVTIRTTNAGVLTQTLAMPLAVDYGILRGINFVNNKVTTNAVLQKTGLGSVFIIDTRISQESNDVTSGACFSVLQGNVHITHSVLNQTNTNPDRLSLEVNPSIANDAFVRVTNSSLSGPSVAQINVNLSPNVDVIFDRCILQQVGVNPASFGVDTNASTTIFSWSEGSLENGNPDFIQANPTSIGVPANLFVGLYWSRLGAVTTSGARQGVSFDTTGVVGSSIFESGAAEHSAVSVVGPNPLVQRASTQASSIFYDNTVSGLVAEDVQTAIDEVAAGALNPTLDDAYDNGRIIDVDADAVELHGPGLETDPPPLNPGNGDGTLRVYQQTEIGAIGDPEISLFSNNFGNGPSIEMGALDVNDDSVPGSSGHLFANTVSADFYNFNLRLATKDAVGNNAVGSLTMGNVIVRCGTALTGSGVNAPNGGNLLLLAGGVEENLGGSPGNVWLSPGITGAGLEGKVNITDSSTSTPSTLTTFNNFVDAAATPAGTLTFATVSGRVDITFAGAENFAAIQSLMSTGTGLSATWAGGGNPIILTSSVTGGDAEILFIADSTGGTINTYLGDFSVSGGAIFVMGSFQDYVSLEATGDQILTIGDGTNDLVYNGITGKLTVPGVIDPTAVIYEQVDHLTDPDVTTSATQGGVFVSDGSGGLVAGDLYYMPASDAAPVNILTGGGGGAPVGATYITEAAEGGLANSKRLQGVAGELSLTPAGGDLNVGLTNTAVTPGTFRRSVITVDSKGRITSAVNDPLVFAQNIAVPTAGLPPITINVYDIWSVGMNAISAMAWMATPFAGTIAPDVTYDILIRPSIAAPGVFTSVIGGPQNIGLLASNASIIAATDVLNKPGPVAIQFSVVFNVLPAAGDGLVITLIGV